MRFFKNSGVIDRVGRLREFSNIAIVSSLLFIAWIMSSLRAVIPLLSNDLFCSQRSSY